MNIISYCHDLVTGCIRMGKKEDHEVDHVRTDNLCPHRIAGMTMWDDAARPTIEGHLGSIGLLPRVPFLKLLLSAPDKVTREATLVEMRLNAPLLHQLA